MANKRLHRKIVSILILICLIVQASLAMPFLSQIWVQNSIGHDVQPSLIAPLSECEYITADKSKEFRFWGEGLYKLYTFIKLPSSNPTFTSIYYRNPNSLPDDREKIKYLIISHFHGSRYKDMDLLSAFH